MKVKATQSKCIVEGNVIVPCSGLEEISEREGYYRQGIQRMENNQFFIIKSGKHTSLGAVINYCPMCGTDISEMLHKKTEGASHAKF